MTPTASPASRSRTTTPRPRRASGALAKDAQTTANIRLIDPKIVSDTFSQLQQYRQYYQFPKELDVDRYDVKGETEDTVIAVRDIDLAGFSSAANTQYNRAFVYTHGYGVTAAYGNQRASDGKPVFLESESRRTVPWATSSSACTSVRPRRPTRSWVHRRARRTSSLDYPSGSDDDNGGNATTTYAGDGGPSLGNFFNRLVYAAKFQSEQILLSNAVNKDSQILYDRDPITRVQKAAPYLTVDSDAYPAIVDHRIQWVVDGYTTSDAYPYSQSQSLSDSIAGAESSTYRTDQVNYIRNSVKATVDAYTGKVTLYTWDTKDPVLKTWQKIFPTSMKPVSSMSAEAPRPRAVPHRPVQGAALDPRHVPRDQRQLVLLG